MTLSELIEELTRVEKENGDLPVRFVVRDRREGIHHPLIDAQLMEGFVLLFGAPGMGTMDWPDARPSGSRPRLK